MRSPSLKLIVAAMIAALALIAAGCGGDDEEGGGEEAALTKEELIAQGDQICAEGDAELEAAAAEEFGDTQQAPPEEQQVEFLSTTVADNIEQQQQELAELNPPEEDAEQYEAILGALEDLVAQLRDDPQGFIEATEPPEASRLAQEYGFSNCGS